MRCSKMSRWTDNAKERKRKTERMKINDMAEGWVGHSAVPWMRE